VCESACEEFFLTVLSLEQKMLSLLSLCKGCRPLFVYLFSLWYIAHSYTYYTLRFTHTYKHLHIHTHVHTHTHTKPYTKKNSRAYPSVPYDCLITNISHSFRNVCVCVYSLICSRERENERKGGREKSFSSIKSVQTEKNSKSLLRFSVPSCNKIVTVEKCTYLNYCGFKFFWLNLLFKKLSVL
jgi:hypothetical protein